MPGAKTDREKEREREWEIEEKPADGVNEDR